jgi:hypothetical protein
VNAIEQATVVVPTPPLRADTCILFIKTLCLVRNKKTTLTDYFRQSVSRPSYWSKASETPQAEQISVLLSTREIAPGYAPGVSLLGMKLVHRGHSLNCGLFVLLISSLCLVVGTTTTLDKSFIRSRTLVPTSQRSSPAFESNYIPTSSSPFRNRQ